MNYEEHYKKATDAFEDLYVGFVEDTEDPDNLKRIKARVYGVYEEPIKIGQIPWARQINNGPIPKVGTLVRVQFENGDHMRPLYYSLDFVGVADRETRDEEIGSILSNKDSFQGVDCGGASFDEPTPPTDGSQNKDRETQLTRNTDEGSDQAILEDKNLKEGEEHYSLTHPSGTYIDITKDGHVVVHSKSGSYLVSESDTNNLVKGSLNLRVEGSVNIKIGSNTITISQTGLEIESPQAQIKGASLQIDGTTLPDPTGKGPFCGLPSCLFTGSPHTGNKSLNN